MKLSSRFSKTVHTLSLLIPAKDAHCTLEWIAGSVGTNPVIIRKILGQIKNAELAGVRESFWTDRKTGRAKMPFEALLSDITMHELHSELTEHINMKK